jgi:hypothetical protein
VPFLYILGLAACVRASAAAPGQAECPAEIRTGQELKSDAKDWDVFIDTANERHPLSGVSYYDGPPRELAQLAPDRSDKRGDSWTFPAREKGRSIWQVCRYSDTSIQLSRKIPDRIKTCRVSFQKGVTVDGRPAPAAVVCH